MSAVTMAKAGISAVPGAGSLPFLPGGGGEMPTRVLHSPERRAGAEALAAYSRTCGFTLKETLPTTWPHIQAFDRHMALITDGAFPFSPMGLVHIANEISQVRPIGFDEALSIDTRLTPLVDHPKGKSFAILTEARVGDEPVWAERSTMLRRGGGAGRSASQESSRGDARPSAWWTLPGDMGARYAAVSGDSNPIHLHALTAKPFGFPRAIVHGMWTKARCLAALESVLPDSFTVEVRFGKPILLPSRVGFGSRQSGENSGIEFAVQPRKGNRPYLEGRIEPRDSERLAEQIAANHRPNTED